MNAQKLIAQTIDETAHKLKPELKPEANSRQGLTRLFSALSKWFSGPDLDLETFNRIEGHPRARKEERRFEPEFYRNRWF